MIIDICGLIVAIGLDIVAWLMVASSIEDELKLKSSPYHKKDYYNNLLSIIGCILLGIFCTVVVLLVGWWCAVSFGYLG